MFERSQASGGTESALIVACASQRLLREAVESYYLWVYHQLRW